MERDSEMHYLGRLRFLAAARGHLQMRLQINKVLKEKPEILQVGVSLKEEVSDCQQFNIRNNNSVQGPSYSSK